MKLTKQEMDDVIDGLSKRVNSDMWSAERSLQGDKTTIKVRREQITNARKLLDEASSGLDRMEELRRERSKGEGR